MKGIIFICIIYQLLYFILNVDSLKGLKVVSACDHEFPFIASIQYIDGQHYCTGSLITKRHILTAAHCLEDEHPHEVRIVLGRSNLRKGTVKYKVAPWYTYNDWASRLRIPGAEDLHDIAIIPLLHEINEANVSPVRLSELNKHQVQGKPATILGWSKSTVLKKAIVIVLQDEVCARKMRLITNEIEYTGPELFCTIAQPHILMHDGDSGGPLLDQYGKLLGVNSGDGPDVSYSWGDFSKQFLQSYQVNTHFGVDYPYYRRFIENVTGYH